MIFPQVDLLPRHPSQLYEATLGGMLLFVILWFYSAKPRSRGKTAALFCLGYGVCRFFVEYFREPDAFLRTSGLRFESGPVAFGAFDYRWSFTLDF